MRMANSEEKNELKEDAREEALSLGIGKKVREFRKKRSLTLAQLSELSGLSVGLLSQVENDGVVPPIPTLLNISRAFGVKLENFFKDEEERPRISLVKRNEQAPEKHRRPASVGYHYNALAHRRADKKMEPFIVEFEPRPKEDMKFFSHGGEEFIFVLEGILEFQSGSASHILEEGDTIYFDSDQPHAVRGVDTKSSKAIIVITS